MRTSRLKYFSGLFLSLVASVSFGAQQTLTNSSGMLTKANQNFTELYGKFPVAVVDGGTGGNSAATARTALGLALGTNVSAWDADLDAISALTPSNDDLLQRKSGSWVNRTIAQYKADLALVKADIGLGNVENTALSTWVGSTNLTTLGTITTGTWTGTAVAVANGGTGSATAANARTALGLAIGANVQAWDADLDSLSASGMTGFANPTASLGLTAVNGSALTAMRSDAAAALDVSIAPIWTGIHTFSAPEPRMKWSESDQTTDEKLYDLDCQGKVCAIRTRTDADGAGVNIISWTRGTGTALSNVTVGNGSSTYTFPGNGTATYTGAVLSSSTAGIISSLGTPVFEWRETDQGSDLKNFRADVASGVWKLRTTTDAGGTGKDAIAVTRGATTALSAIAVGNTTDNPTFTTAGTGANTFNGSTVLLPNITATSAAQQGTVCWATGGGLTVDTTVACLASTRKVKQNIQLLDIGLDQVMKLQPVSYDLKPEFNQAHLGPQIGLVAEDVQKVDPRLVALDDKGDPRGVRYMQLTAVLVKAIQQQQAEIAYLKWQVWGAVIAIVVAWLVLMVRRRRVAM